MPSIAVLDMNRQKVGEVYLSDEIFASEVKEHLMHLALRIQLANRRAGTVGVKTRSEVAGSGKKPFKQKGTGNARQGCRRAPQYPGGGVAFGPQAKEYNLSINKKARNAALRSALSLQFKNDRIMVFDKINFDKISTKSFVEFMNRVGVDRTLIITDDLNNNLQLSSRNVPHVKLLKYDALNIHDMLKYKNLIITQGAVQFVEGALHK
ncbi:MAG: 50S ribosomal protein L4 [Geobacter sp.]|nr:MAG: 50S ribosomal protein L4 [Geobacter sp.]